jgi:hypothetical protein
MDEASGENRTNSTDTAQHLVSVNTVGQQPGIVGNAAEFNRSALRKLTNSVNDPSYTNETGFTVGFWVKPTTNTAENVGYIGTQDYVDVAGNTWVMFGANGTQMFWRVNVFTDTNNGFGTVSYASGTPVATGTYNNLATTGGTGTGGKLNLAIVVGRVVATSQTSAGAYPGEGSYGPISASGGVGSGATATFVFDACGNLISFTINNAGQDYAVNDTLSFDIGSCNIWTYNVDAVDFSVTPSVHTVGANYTLSDTVTVAGNLIGGSTPVNDINFTVDTLSTTSELKDISVSWNYTTAAVTNAWTHWVGTADPTNSRSILYSNGVAVATNSWGVGRKVFANGLTDNYISVGEAGGNNFTGLIDGVFYHKGVLSPSEILYPYRGGLGREYQTNGTWTTP